MLSEYEIAISRLHKKRKVDKNYICPCHDDHEGSLSVHCGENGKALINCFAGCSYESIIKVLDLRPDKINDSPVITATYDYTDKDGKLLYQVVRYHPKSFKQRQPDGKGDWIWNLKGLKPTLYHLPEVLQAVKELKTIWIVEGEKDVDNLRKHGQAATTISGGASTKWPPELIPLFEDSNVAIIPDNDPAGKKYAQYVTSILHGWCASLKVIELLEKDVTDYLETHTVDNLLNIAYNTKEFIPPGVVTRDEFESWKGVNRWLWGQLNKKQATYKDRI